MLLTLYYMATTWFQSYRLSNIKSNFKKYLSNSLTLVVYKEKDFVGLENESMYANKITIYFLFFIKHFYEIVILDLYTKENGDIFLSLRPLGITSDSCKDARSAQLDQILSFVGHKRSCSVSPEVKHYIRFRFYNHPKPKVKHYTKT